LLYTETGFYSFKGQLAGMSPIVSSLMKKEAYQVSAFTARSCLASGMRFKHCGFKIVPIPINSAALRRKRPGVFHDLSGDREPMA